MYDKLVCYHILINDVWWMGMLYRIIIVWWMGMLYIIIMYDVTWVCYI